MMKRVLVTGGLGFIGSNLCRRILDTRPGCALTIIDNLSGTVTDWSDLEGRATIEIADLRAIDPTTAAYEEVWHLASPVGSLGILDRTGTIANDILDLASHAQRIAETTGAQILYVSSSEVYGHDGRHDEEVDLVVPNRRGARMEYALGKLTAEHTLYNRCLNSGQRLTIVRPFNCAGPGQSQALGFVFPSFVSAALEGRPLSVHGDGSARRAFCHVDDMVSGILAVQEHGVSGSVYNVGQPNGAITIHDLAVGIVAQLNSKSTLEFVDPKRIYGPHWTDAFDKLPDIRRARTDTGWRPAKNLEQIVADVAASLSEHAGRLTNRMATTSRAGFRTTRRVAATKPEVVSLGGALFRPSNYLAIEAAARAHFSDPTAPLLLSYVNPHVITVADNVYDVGRCLSRCDHIVVDGVGVWLPLALAGLRVDHCAGYELADRLLASTMLSGDAVIVGIESDHHVALRAEVERRCPNLRVVAAVDGFASMAESRSILSEFSEADVVLIGAGTPKSECLVLAAAELCGHALIANVGAGTLLAYAGARKHAPRTVYRAGFEWAFRFWREPHTRTRYLQGLPRYLRLLARGWPQTIDHEQENQ